MIKIKVNKLWQIIIASLCLQGLIIAILLSATADEFKGQYGGLSYVIIYTPAVLGMVFIFFLFFYSMRKSFPGLPIIGTILSLVAWFVIPLTFTRARTMIRERAGNDRVVKKQNEKSEKYHKSQQVGSIRVAQRIGLSTYTWIPAYNLLSVETLNGKRHNFIWQQNILNVYCEISQPPPATDTVSWLKLLLTEASTYIRKDYKLFELCINSHDYNYNYNSYNNTNSIHISISHGQDKSIRLYAIFKVEAKDEYYGNLSFQLPYDTTAKWTPAN